MKKTFKILLATMSILILGVFMLYIFTNDFERKLNILDCEGIYYSKIFENNEENLLYNNAKVDIAKCLCEKYQQNKSEKYKTEILKFYKEFDSEYKEQHPKPCIDSICKYKDEIFWKIYYE